MRLLRFSSAVLFLFVFYSNSISQENGTESVQERLAREFSNAHPQPGDYLPPIFLPQIQPDASKHFGGEYSFSLRGMAQRGVNLFVTASLTCPKTRKHMPALQSLKEKFGDELGIILVYVIEAHPVEDICPYLGFVDVTAANERDQILFRQPTNLNDRKLLAKKLMRMYPLDATVLIDSMDNAAWKTLGQSPNVAILADRTGRVLQRQGWLDPTELEPLIPSELSKAIRNPSLTFGGMSPSKDEPIDLGLFGARQDSPSKDGLPEEKEEESADQEIDEAMEADLRLVLSKLDPKYPNEWSLVRWLENVDDSHLDRFLKLFPRLLHYELQYGVHDHIHATILDLMVERGDLAKVKAVCEAGASINRQVREQTPLSRAIVKGHLPIAEYLIQRGASVNLCPVDDYPNLLHLAILHGQLPIAKILIQAGIEQDIYTLAGTGDIEKMRPMLEESPSIGLSFNSLGHSPIAYAVSCNQSSMVDLLLERKMLVECRHPNLASLSTMAVHYADAEILEKLLSQGVESKPLVLAMELRKFEHFRTILRHNPKLDAVHRGKPLLHTAMLLNLPVEYLRMLLECGVDINATCKKFRDEDGCGPTDVYAASLETALHFAARLSRPDYVKLLLDHGAKKEELDAAKLTPLGAAIHELVFQGDSQQAKGLETIQTLLEYGCSTDIKDTKGNLITAEIFKAATREPPQFSESKVQLTMRSGYGNSDSSANGAPSQTPSIDEATYRREVLSFKLPDYNPIRGFDSSKLYQKPVVAPLVELLNRFHGKQ